MRKILFVDGCVRGRERSSTYQVARAFLEAFQKANPQDQLEEVELLRQKPECFTGKEIELRDQLLREGRLDAPLFDLARQFAQADGILVAAPYWDLSFPALVKAYIENVSVCGITFGYGPEGQELGLCKAKKLLFVTTSGGAFPEEQRWLRGTGMDDWKALCWMFGIPDFDFLWVQGLDLEGNDRQALLRQGMEQAAQLGARW